MPKSFPHNDLYKILGVERNASRDKIKKSYKKKAMQSHPDMPTGSTKKFSLVKKAYDVLSDESRRKKYDDTGDIDEGTPENKFSDVGNIIVAMLNSVLKACADRGQSPLELDMVLSIKETIKQNVSELRKQQRIMKNVLETDKKLAGRFSVKSGENFMENVIKYRIADLNVNLTRIEKQINDMGEAQKMVSEYSFRYDKPEKEDKWSGMGVSFIGY